MPRFHRLAGAVALALGCAGAAQAQQFSSFVVFGDSLSDSGNIAAASALPPGTSFTTEVLQNAPSFNRDVRDIIRIDPRVSLDRSNEVDRVSCLGGNDRSNAFTVDGIGQGDVYGLNDTGFSSRSSTPIPYDAVRETQVQFAPFDVDYGAFTGCAINVVTKSGTSRFKGSKVIGPPPRLKNVMPGCPVPWLRPHTGARFAACCANISCVYHWRLSSAGSNTHGSQRR